MTNQEFASLWNASETIAAVCDATKQSHQGAAVKASRLRRLGLSLKLMQSPTKTLAERFWNKVTKGAGCWLWFGSKNKKGYGQIQAGRRGGRPLQAHRVAWELHHGKPLPANAMVLHRCDNPACVNPAHLFIGSAAENTQDMMEKGRGWWQPNAPRRKTFLRELIEEGRAVA